MTTSKCRHNNPQLQLLVVAVSGCPKTKAASRLLVPPLLSVSLLLLVGISTEPRPKNLRQKDKERHVTMATVFYKQNNYTSVSPCGGSQPQGILPGNCCLPPAWPQRVKSLVCIQRADWFGVDRPRVISHLLMLMVNRITFWSIFAAEKGSPAIRNDERSVFNAPRSWNAAGFGFLCGDLFPRQEPANRKWQLTQ